MHHTRGAVAATPIAAAPGSDDLDTVGWVTGLEPPLVKSYRAQSLHARRPVCRLLALDASLATSTVPIRCSILQPKVPGLSSRPRTDSRDRRRGYAEPDASTTSPTHLEAHARPRTLEDPVSAAGPESAPRDQLCHARAPSRQVEPPGNRRRSASAPQPLSLRLLVHSNEGCTSQRTRGTTCWSGTSGERGKGGKDGCGGPRVP